MNVATCRKGENEFHASFIIIYKLILKKKMLTSASCSRWCNLAAFVTHELFSVLKKSLTQQLSYQEFSISCN